MLKSKPSLYHIIHTNLFCSHSLLVSSMVCLTKSSLKGLRLPLFLAASFTRFSALSPSILSGAGKCSLKVLMVNFI